jgi:hypothetical protein
MVMLLREEYYVHVLIYNAAHKIALMEGYYMLLNQAKISSGTDFLLHIT